ncbi:MAG: glycerate kinase [Rikenellaceae bacterium]|nr:glycerate kinase [Rikenellaceae bacterium]
MAEKFKILVVADKFKGSLSSEDACNAIKRGLENGCRNYMPGREILIHTLPMADGGDGTLDVVEKAIGGERIYATVSDPLFREIEVPFILRNKMAFVEMALCSGLQLLKKEEYNPSITSTYGLGETIIEALRQGAEEVVVGIGGSATNDGGMGMLKAFGYEFFDRRGNEALSLDNVCEISSKNVIPQLENVKFTVASDVNNPLLGERGASVVYSPQKGADSEMVELLERGMRNYSELCKEFAGKDLADYPGSGAAGGTGYAFKCFLNAEIAPGWQILSKLTYMDKLIAAADLVVTGEGLLDIQSVSGKLINGVCKISSDYNRSVWVFCGASLLSGEDAKEAGISKVFEISTIAKDREDSIINAADYLEKTAVQSAAYLPDLNVVR